LDEKGVRVSAFGGWRERVDVNPAVFIVVGDVETGGVCFVDEQANVRVKDASGATEEGQ